MGNTFTRRKGLRRSVEYCQGMFVFHVKIFAQQCLPRLAKYIMYWLLRNLSMNLSRDKPIAHSL